MSNPAFPRCLMTSFDRVSFLRTSDPSTDHEVRDYHFLHMTFQEFFAAQYLVRCWTSDMLLSYLKFDSDHKSRKPTSPKRFVQQEKYSGRYDIFGRFVVWLLPDKGEEELCQFLEQIEGEPRDLLGPVHQWLLMHCFNNVPHSRSKTQLENHRVRMGQQCRLWASYEYKLHKEMYMCRGVEFPEHNLNEMLTHEPDDVRTATLRAISRPHLLSNLLDLTANFLREDYGNYHVRLAAIEALSCQSSLPDNIFQALVTKSNDCDSGVREAAIRVLGRQSSLPDNVLQALVCRLDDDNFRVKMATIQTLRCQSSLPDNVLQILISQLDDHWFDIGFQVEEVLRKHDSFYSTFPRLHTQKLLALYRIWLLKLCSRQFSLYMRGGVLYIYVPDRRRRIPLKGVKFSKSS